MAVKDPDRLKEFEAGLKVIQEAVDQVNAIAEGTSSSSLSSADYMRYYTVVFDLSASHPLGDFTKELYDKYKQIFEDHITLKVLPCLREKNDQELLQELVRKWGNYKIITRWLSKFFWFLGRYYIPTRKLPSLQETSFIAFHNLVYGEVNSQIRNAAISMINMGREGEEIDEVLLKNILAIYIEMGIDSNKYYEQDFEEAMLKDSAAFYSRKSSNWKQNKSHDDYLIMVEDCIKHETETVSSYLQSITQEKLLQVVRYELLNTELEGLKPLDRDLQSS
ncbi:cullin-1-like isoform X2 [Mercurialis annua]|uniref:cullin-1-like isoform X2 n=1 Tax=Mercurialis annua TaxID=3986 RepID=UPI00215F3AAF|nr:cullin-1-like isoform X2 [Mercurialis annua]